MTLRPPSVIVLAHTSASNAVVFQSLAIMPNARMSLCTQSVHYFSFPPRSLRTVSSRFPNTRRFGNRPPLIRVSAPAHKSPLVRNVVSMLSHRIISRAWLTRSSDGLIFGAVRRWCGAGPCGVRCGVRRSVPDEESKYCIHTVEP